MSTIQGHPFEEDPSQRLRCCRNEPHSNWCCGQSLLLLPLAHSNVSFMEKKKRHKPDWCSWCVFIPIIAGSNSLLWNLLFQSGNNQGDHSYWKEKWNYSQCILVNNNNKKSCTTCPWGWAESIAFTRIIPLRIRREGGERLVLRIFPLWGSQGGKSLEEGEENTFGLKIVFILPKPIVRRGQIVVSRLLIQMGM